MSTFDPDAFLAAKPAAFDPDSFVSSGLPDFLKQRGKLQPDGSYTVDTPDGPARFDSTGKSLDVQAGGVERSTKEAVLSKVLATAQSGAQGFVPQLAGIKAVLEKDDPEHAAENYRKARDSAKTTVEPAVENEGIGYQILGALPSALVGAPSTMAGRIALAGGLGAANAAAGSSADLTKDDADVGQFLKDTAIGGGAGVVAGGVGEALGAGLRKGASVLEDRAAKAIANQTAKDAAAVEKEIASIQGKLGAETQKGSRLVENLQRFASSTGETEGGASAVGDTIRAEVEKALESPASRELAESVAQSNLKSLPGQKASIDRLTSELASRQASAAGDAAKRTADYFASPLFTTEVLPRLKTLAPRFGMAAFGMAAGAGYDAATGNGSGHGLAAGFAGGVLGAPGVRQMLKNVAASPRVQVAIANKLAPLLQTAAHAIGIGAVPTMNVLAGSMLHERDLGEPSLAAEQLVARGGLKSVIGDHPPDDPLVRDLNAPRSELDRAIAQTVGIATVAGALEDHHAQMDRAVNAAIKGEKQPPSGGPRDLPKDVTHLVDSNALLDRLTNNMGNFADIAPSVHGHVAATAQRAVDYLQKTAAAPPKAGPLAPDWEPSQGEKHALTQAVEVVENPLAVLKHAAAGTLTAEHIQALQAVYPMLARTLEDKVLMRLADSKGVSYRQRLMLGLLSGVDVDGSLAATQQNQAAIRSAPQKPSTQGAESAAPKHTTHFSLAQRTAMPHERQEADK